MRNGSAIDANNTIESCSVIGAGGHGKVVVSLLKNLKINISAVYDDDQNRWGQSFLGIPVVGPIEQINRSAIKTAVLAIGDNATRMHLSEKLDLDWQTVVHPTAFVEPSAKLGVGTMVMPKAVVHTDATVGKHAIINTASVIEHDARIGDFVHVAPGCHLAGNVSVGSGALVGIGSCALISVRIGAWSIVGAGSVATRNIPPGVVAMGTPAKPVSNKNSVNLSSNCIGVRDP